MNAMQLFKTQNRKLNDDLSCGYFVLDTVNYNRNCLRSEFKYDRCHFP